MKQKRLALWFSVVSVILVLFGLVYVFFGLRVLPVDKKVLLDWESGLYGAIMIGWGLTLFAVGRIAFRRADKDLMKALLYGLIGWLVFEAGVSAYLGVWFNVGVDAAVLALFAIPLLKMR
ncbi:MAG TPA: hypothetical protein VLH84_00305 [Patescibacteria group bacterium]|nr:hypothetical protein [Patescibacteria group bacterium]